MFKNLVKRKKEASVIFRFIGKFMTHLILLLVLMLSITPFISMILGAISSSANIKSGYFDTKNIFYNLSNNWNDLFSDKYFFVAIKNTFIISSLSTITTLIVASLSGYCMVIFKNKYTQYIFYFVFFSLMIPASSTIIAIFKLFQYFNLLDTSISVIISSLPLGFIAFMFTQNTKYFPYEIIEAARIDGLSETLIFLRIFIPSMSSTFAAGTIITFTSSWNNYLFPLVLLQSRDKITVGVYLSSISAKLNPNLGLLMLALTLSILPIFSIYILFSKHLKYGIFK